MTWKRICDAAEMPENSVRQFDVDGISIVLVNYGEGFRAIPPICPHMEEPLVELWGRRALYSHLHETFVGVESQDPGNARRD